MGQLIISQHLTDAKKWDKGHAIWLGLKYNPVTYPAIAVHTQRLLHRNLPAAELRIHDLSSLALERPFKRAPRADDFEGCTALQFLTKQALDNKEAYSQIIFADFDLLYQSMMAELIRGLASSKKVAEFARILASEALCKTIFDLATVKSVFIVHEGEIPTSLYKVQDAVR